MIDLRSPPNGHKSAPLSILGAPTFIHATGATTAGAYALIEQWMPHGYATPYHRHDNEDEAFLVLEGEVAFVLDGNWTLATPGTFLFGPRNHPHGLEIRNPSGARVLVLTTPSGFEHFLENLQSPSATNPPPLDHQQLSATALTHGIHILGPLPT